MRPSFLISLAAALLLTPALNAADNKAVLGPAREAVEKVDFRAGGRLVRVEADNRRVSFPLQIKAHWFPGVLRVFVDLGKPSGTAAADSHLAPVHLLLELRPGGQNSIQIAHPGDKALAQIPVEHWSDGLGGAGFAYEDFFEAQYFWANQSVSGPVKFGARICDLVTSSPGAGDRSHYSQVKSWLDHAISFPVYVEKTPRSPGPAKEYTYYGLRQEGGLWSASQIEEKNHGLPGASLLMIERGSPKAHLALSDFSSEQLLHF